jgi:xanthine dehydrogenase YagR molybdenum-binding subunit
MANTWPKERRLIGKKFPRLDAPEKATGRAKYSFDVNRPGMLHGKILRCPYAHATLKSIDTSAAEKMPGVAAVHVIAQKGKTFEYVGDEIVGLAADTEEHARDAIRAIKVEFDILDFLVKEEDALKATTKTVNAGNVAQTGQDTKGDVAAAFQAADGVVEGDYGIAVIAHQCLESHGLVAEWGPDDMLTVWCSTQATTNVANGLAKQFKIPATKVKCITHHMGAGYGSKFGEGVEGATAAHLAKKAGKPVKLMLERDEEILTGGTRPGSFGRIKIAGTKDGKITAFESVTYGTPGNAGGAGVNFQQLPYVFVNSIPNLKKTNLAVRLNVAPTRAWRAPGHPQSSVLTEWPIDDLAAKLGIDPMQLRLKNLPQNAAAAVKNAPTSLNALVNTIYTDEIKIAAKLSEWSTKWHPPGQNNGDGPVKHGIGMAIHTWGGGGRPDNDVKVRISSDGSVLVESSTQDLGTGERTVLAIVIAEILGLEVKDITVRIGESPYGRSTGSGGSTTCPGTSPAALIAANEARDALFDKLAGRFNAKKEDLAIEPGKIVNKADKKSWSWKEACARLGTESVMGQGNHPSLQDNNKLHLSNNGVGGVQTAEVKVDTETGVVRLVKMVAVQDCGMIINKQGCESQVAGGVIMGLNPALFEERIMDRHTGRQVNPDMEFYKLGGIEDMPEIVVHMHDMPERGVIGIGEPPTISTCAAIGNAIFNAIGVRVPYAPFTPQRVLEALTKKGGKA